MTSKRRIQAKHLVKAEGPELLETTSEMLDTQTYKYLLVNVIARRAREINKGAKPQVELDGPATMTDFAIGEVEENKVQLVRRQTNRVLINMIDNE